MNELNKYDKKSSIIHPILFAIFPIILIYSENIHLLPSTEIIFPLITVVGLSVLAYFSIGFILKNKNKAALIITLFLVIFFSYGHIYNLINAAELGDFEISRHRYLLIPFCGSLVFGIIYFLKTKRKLDSATTITSFISCTIIGLILFNVIVDVTQDNFFGSPKLSENERFLGVGPSDQTLFSSIFPSSTQEQKLIQKNIDSSKNKLPDIYYIILDEYGSNKALKKFFGYDNSEFVSFLEENDFFVVSESYTNYPTTIQSLSASLNMEYVNYLTEKVGEKSKNFRMLNQILSDNKVMQKLHEENYNIINVGSLWGPNNEFKNANANVCEFKEIGRDSLSRQLLQTSIISYLQEMWTYEGSRDRVLCVFNELPKLDEKFSSPKFVFVHILIPHPPYIFGPNGEHVKPGTPLNSEVWDDRDAYIDQLKFANKKTKTLVNELINAENKPIIIIQGDTGPGFGFDRKKPSKEMIEERMSNLNAYFFPESSYLLYDGITQVNSFRIIFNEILGTDYELLDDRIYWSSSDQPYNHKDVTELLKHGTNLQLILIPDDGDTFGNEIGLMEDFDNDGTNDIVIGASQDDDGGQDRGAVYILFLNKDGTVKEYQKISDTEGNFEGEIEFRDYFGRDIDDIGDLNGDGINELAVGAFRNDNGGKDRGAVYILFLNKDGTVKEYQKIPNLIN